MFHPHRAAQISLYSSDYTRATPLEDDQPNVSACTYGQVLQSKPHRQQALPSGSAATSNRTISLSIGYFALNQAKTLLYAEFNIHEKYPYGVRDRAVDDIPLALFFSTLQPDDYM